jgi:hypothetical protein
LREKEREREVGREKDGVSSIFKRVKRWKLCEMMNKRHLYLWNIFLKKEGERKRKIICVV